MLWLMGWGWARMYKNGFGFPCLFLGVGGGIEESAWEMCNDMVMFASSFSILLAELLTWRFVTYDITPFPFSH
jgi:hypothetical protein